MRSRATALLLAVLLTAAVGACGDDGSADDSEDRTAAAFGDPPDLPDGALDPQVAEAAADLVNSAAEGQIDGDALEAVAASGDVRLGWLLSDLLRFAPPGAGERRIVAAFAELTGAAAGEAGVAGSAWLELTDHMIAWDPPAQPGYRKLKAKLFTALEPEWRPFFADAGSEIDWRLVSWGGVLIDDRPPGDPRPCPSGCIPALDDPGLTSAAEGGWYPDDRTVFGVVVGGEAVAFPKNVMEVHEMVNVTIGGRRLGIPYCTLCGSPQAYLTDSAPRRFATPVLRTSGLLSRSNKVMYDFRTGSVLDTFTGRALSGPLHDGGVTLEQVTVVASSWGEWKREHPGTRIVAEDGGIGRSYPFDPLAGRDDAGPIFPVGDVDPRLPAQAEVVGAVVPGGGPIAFPAEEAGAALSAGEEVSVAGADAIADGDGLRVVGPDGDELPAHRAFWFAWSQFHPSTELWSPAR